MLEIKTETLQMMVNKSVRGASNNQLIPLTSYMGITMEGDTFSLLTTDGLNYLQVTSPISGAPMKAVVLADVFAQLVRRLSGEVVSLDLTDRYLVVECNGTYKLELLLDDEGNAVPFAMPENFDTLEGKEKLGEISRETLSRIFRSLKQSISKDSKYPHYGCYRLGEEIISTDKSLVSILNTKVFDTPRLLSAEGANLLDAITVDTAVCYIISDSAMVFDTGNDVLYTQTPPSVRLENFNAKALKGFVTEEFAWHCTISVQAVLDALERIALFISPRYDAGAIYLNFDADGVTLSSKNTSGVEQVVYETVDGEPECSCVLDVNGALSLFKAQPSAVVDFYFGNEQAVKVVDGDLVTILSMWCP